MSRSSSAPAIGSMALWNAPASSSSRRIVSTFCLNSASERFCSAMVGSSPMARRVKSFASTVRQDRQPRAHSLTATRNDDPNSDRGPSSHHRNPTYCVVDLASLLLAIADIRGTCGRHWPRRNCQFRVQWRITFGGGGCAGRRLCDSRRRVGTRSSRARCCNDRGRSSIALAIRRGGAFLLRSHGTARGTPGARSVNGGTHLRDLLHWSWGIV